MAKTPNFDKIVATITDSDIKHLLESSAPDDVKEQVREAATHEIKTRFVAGYMIRTNQIKPDRLNPKPAKPGRAKAVKKVTKARQKVETDSPVQPE
jgi:hypothetical protein